MRATAWPIGVAALATELRFVDRTDVNDVPSLPELPPIPEGEDES